MGQNSDRALILVIEAASEALEVPIEDLPPLSESINLDGLDAVVNYSEDAEVTVTFSYAGLRVFVHSSGLVCVRPRWDDGTPRSDGAFVPNN